MEKETPTLKQDFSEWVKKTIQRVLTFEIHETESNFDLCIVHKRTIYEHELGLTNMWLLFKMLPSILSRDTIESLITERELHLKKNAKFVKPALDYFCFVYISENNLDQVYLQQLGIGDTQLHRRQNNLECKIFLNTNSRDFIGFENVPSHFAPSRTYILQNIFLEYQRSKVERISDKQEINQVIGMLKIEGQVSIHDIANIFGKTEKEIKMIIYELVGSNKVRLSVKNDIVTLLD